MLIKNMITDSNTCLLMFALASLVFVLFDIPSSFADEFIHGYNSINKFDENNPQTIKEQLADGIPYNHIICYSKYDYVIYRVSDGSPACVNFDHAAKIIDRGWGFLGTNNLS